MAFWETVTIAEMSVLLEKKERPDVREGWEKLSELIGATDPGSIDKNNKKLSDCPLTPAVYFFLCVRESARYAADDPLPRRVRVELDNVKCLPEFSVGGGDRNVVVIKYAFQNREPSQEMMLYPPSTALGELLDGIEKDNLEQWAQGEGAQYLMEDGLKNLRGFLNDWDETCEKMWMDIMREVCARLCDEDPTLKEVHDLVEGGAKQIILTGAPGTGKTRTAGLAARYMGTPLVEYSTDHEHPYPLVQFHPSYDYTDFMEGLRPVQLEGQDDGAARFVKLDGSFKAFCRSVARENKARTEDPKNDPNRRYFFLIDEINRADLSKVFGELMFCLETGKRGRPMQTQYRNLPTYAVDRETQRAALLPREDDVFADGFFIPENVIILGTMNDIDRSVESMDFALRRRFVFWEVKVDEAMLTRAFASGGLGQILKDNAGMAAQRVMALNGVIDSAGGQFGLNRQFYISQGQFVGLPEKQTLDEMLCSAWEFRIEPLLGEYVRGEDDTASFLKACAKALLGVDPGEQEPDQ